MKLDSESQTDYSEIKSNGMLKSIGGGWIKIQITVLPYKETERAYYGLIRVDELVDGEPEMLYNGEKTTWIPKSMAENVWWICTNTFDETRKVSNRTFEKKQNYHEPDDYDPYLVKREEEE